MDIGDGERIKDGRYTWNEMGELMNQGKKSILPIIGIWLIFHLVTVVADSRFIENNDGTITDLELKIIWFNTDNQGDISWEDGIRWTKFSVPFAAPQSGIGSWRLPTINELKSLYNSALEGESTMTDCGMRVRIIPQIHLTCGWVWSAEESGDFASVFTFRLGYHYSDSKKNRNSHRILAVRDLK